MFIRRFVVLLFVLFPLLGCGVSTVKTELIFGLRDRLDNRDITLAEWNSFVNKEVKPRFDIGFTVAQGCIGSLKGITDRKFGVEGEDCRILVIVHPKTREYEDKIGEIMLEYKGRFHQEAVLRLESPVSQTLS